MFIETVRNRNSPPCILLRETYRSEGKVKHRTLANFSKLPAHVIAGIRCLLKANPDPFSASGASPFRIQRSLPHGHVAAVLSAMNSLGISSLLGSKKSPERQLCLALIASRILSPGSKLATSRTLRAETATDTLAQECALPEDIHENDLYAAMDWLLPRQARIEKALARRHLHEGALVLYDLTSSYFEGSSCPLAKLGHNRDGKKGKLQVEYGLLCNAAGVPVAVEVFEGNVADPMTLGTQIQKVRDRFGINQLVLVGDRGMITQARIDEELRDVDGLDWITALRSSAILKLADQGLIEPSLFDQTNLAQIHSPDFPGERLIVCRNPFLARSRAYKREDLLAATEKELAKIHASTQRAKNPLRGKAAIGLKLGRVINKHKMAKHFLLTITDTGFSAQRRTESIAREAAIDGIYVVRTSTSEDLLSASEAVARYKDLSLVENAFRSIKTVDLKVRPIHHHAAGRVRCHIFLCMLAYYVEWHMRSALKSVLFDDEHSKAPRADVVVRKRPSPSARAKTITKRTPEGAPVHSFQTLLKDLATLCRNTIVSSLPGSPSWHQETEATPHQKTILDLLSRITACSQ
jgi:transposase